MDAPTRRAEEGRAPRKRVLVVDDSVDTARLMKLLLKAEGFEVETAHDGPEALRAARCHPPDIVLLDLTLPTMDGLEVAAELRSTEGLDHARIIAVSGHAEDKLPDPSPFDTHLMKPVDLDRLIKLLRERTDAVGTIDPTGIELGPVLARP